MDVNSGHLSPDYTRLYLKARAETERIEAKRRPRIRVWDKDWNYVSEFYGEIAAKFGRRLYDSAPGEVEAYADHPLRRWMTEELKDEEDIHFTVDTQWDRWSGKVSHLQLKSNGTGRDRLTIHLIDEYEHLKKITCYSNPFLPPEFQFPKIWMYAGPSEFGIKTILFANLLRRFAPLWSLPENIYEPNNWLQNLNPEHWPIFVKPTSLFSDTSMWTVIATRFGNAHDVITPILKDAGLCITYRRWLPGDPQPAPAHANLTKPTLVLDVVDKSGVRGPSGNMVDGLLSFASRIAGDGVQEIVEVVDPGAPPPEYDTPGYFGTKKELPWVFYRNAMRTGLSGISSWEMNIHKALAGAIITGGKSPGWVNSGIKLILNAVLGYLGLIFGNPALGIGIFEKYVEDVILAFHRVGLSNRQALMGRGQYGEHWEPVSGTGFSLPALQAFRVGQQKTRAYTSFKISIRDGAPYWYGKHMTIGDRVVGEINDSKNLYVDQIFASELSWSRTQDPIRNLSIGDDAAEDPLGTLLGRQLEQVRAIMQSIAVES